MRAAVGRNGSIGDSRAMGWEASRKLPTVDHVAAQFAGRHEAEEGVGVVAVSLEGRR